MRGRGPVEVDVATGTTEEHFADRADFRREEDPDTMTGVTGSGTGNPIAGRKEVLVGGELLGKPGLSTGDVERGIVKVVEPFEIADLLIGHLLDYTPRADVVDMHHFSSCKNPAKW